MPSSDTFIRHLFGGGFATDLGPSTDVAPQGVGDGISQMVIPFLTQCDNVMFELDGGFTKSPGTTKINSAALESGAQIRGCYDYWIQGAVGAPTQKRVIHVGTKIKADAADGVFADIATGVSATAVPSYATFNDVLIISDDANSAPKVYDGTTCSALSGSPPNFSFCVEHKGRLFAAGVASNPSRLYYSDAFDHTAGWTNYITIGTNDGSGITGLASFKNALVIFKGPKKGSIYVLSGDTTSTFSLAALRKNCGSAVWQNSIFQYGDDLSFMASDGSVQTLSATAAFGSFSLGYLSRDISQWVSDHIVRTQLKKCWAVNWESKGIVLFTLPVDASTYPNTMLMMDYRFDDKSPRWSPWPAYAGACNSAVLATDETDNSRQIVLTGGNDGYLRKLDVGRFSIDNATAITATVRTPNLSYGSPHLTKTPVAGSIAFKPLTDDAVTFTYYRDNQTSTSLSIDQGGGDFLAPSSSTDFTLDTSTLGGGQFNDQWFEIENGGEVRSLAYEMSSTGLDANISIHSLSIFLRGAALSLENA